MFALETELGDTAEAIGLVGLPENPQPLVSCSTAFQELPIDRDRPLKVKAGGGWRRGV
jgi:hypothetical protein